MATSGTNYTMSWEISDGVLRIFPTNGISGIARTPQTFFSNDGLISFLNGVTDEEFALVHTIIFEEDVAFHEWKYVGHDVDPRYAPAGFFNFFRKTASDSVSKDVLNENIQKIDVSGLNTINASSFEGFFRGLANLTELVGLNNLNTQSVTRFNYMFGNTPLSTIDISSWVINQGDQFIGMFDKCNYLLRLTLPSNLNVLNTGTETEGYAYKFGLVPKNGQATKNGVTISSDEDFFKLSISQGGVWERDVSGTATLSFKVTSVERDGNDAILNYNYFTVTAVANIYVKTSSQSSFPSSPTQTLNLEGTGTDSTTIQLALDDAYDVMIIVDDGETTLYTYPSIDSNILLLQIDEEGNVEASGDITDGSGNVLSDKVSKSMLLDFCHPVWSTYQTLDASFDPNVAWGGTWEMLPEGYILLSGSESGTYQVGTDTTTSGYKEYGENSHILTTDEMPAHTHGNKSLSGSFQARHYGTSGNGAQLVFAPSGIVSIDSNTGTLGKVNVGGAGSNGGYEIVKVNASHEHNSVGDGQAHNVMQKSIAVYTWIRTA